MMPHIYLGARLQLALFVLLMASVKVQSRQWQSIVNHDIARKSNIDSNRYELKIEVDPFFFAGDPSPTEIPTEAPKTETKKAWTTVAPEKSSSMLSSKPTMYTGKPTMSPTKFNTEQNGGCGHGTKPYEIHMKDTWGDGWDQTMLTITKMTDQNHEAMTSTSQDGSIVAISKTIEIGSSNSNPSHQIFQGTLEDGYHDFANICLSPYQCYELAVTSSEFAEEASWELRANGMDLLISGGAPTRCTFSIPDSNGHHFCAKVCSDPVTEPPVVVEYFPEDEEAIEAVTETFMPSEEMKLGSDAFMKSMLETSGGYGGSSATSLWNNLKIKETEAPMKIEEQVEAEQRIGG